MPEDQTRSPHDRNSPGHRITRIEHLSKSQLRDLLDEMIAALTATTSSSFIESLRSLTPDDVRSLLLDLAREHQDEPPGRSNRPST